MSQLALRHSDSLVNSRPTSCCCRVLM